LFDRFLPERLDEKLEDVFDMLDMEWSKDDYTKTQCNWFITSPLHRGNASNKNVPARVKRRIQWEAPSKPLAVDDPLLLPERAVLAEIGINWFLDRKIPEGGYVRILAESLLWEERLGKTRIRTTEGLREREIMLFIGKSKSKIKNGLQQRASLHAWSRTEGGQLRAAVGNFDKSDG